MTCTMSFWLLVVISIRFNKFFRHRNRQTPPRRFWVHDVLRHRDDLVEYARLVQELRLGNDSFHGNFWVSTEQFDYVLELVGPHILRLPTAYAAVYVHGRTTSYDVVRSRSNRTHAQHRSHSHYARRRTRPYVVKRRNRDMLDFCMRTSYVRRRTTSCVSAHAQPRTQLVDVKCVVPPVPEHSQTVSLTSESIGGSCHCPAEVLAYSAKSSRPRSTS